MSRNYDNWERLVAAVIKRQQNWQLCHQLSITTPSICSEASSVSDFSSSSNYFQVSDDVMFENNEESGHQKPVPKLVPVKGVLNETWQLGKGRFGTSILTLLQRGVQVSDQEFFKEGTQLVMKKLRSKVVKVTEEEFSVVFANCRHENVAAPRAYYFSVNGNFIFNDYHSQGSVYDWLHGNDYIRPSWESRLKIAIGAAQGITHIHKQCGGKLAHGNVKTSNIFLNSEQYGCVADFGLAGITIRPGMWVAARHHSSEYNLKNASQESDVYSFGVVLLQLVTGKLPVEPHGGFRRNVDIVGWALSMRPEDWSSKLFDKSLWSSELSNQSYSDTLLCDELDMFKFEGGLEVESMIKAEMVEMMQVARKCLATLPQDRPKMFEVVLNLNSICNKPRPRITSNLNCCLLSHYN